jgi:hypothetical protein
METPMLLVQDVQVAVVRGRKLEDMLSFLNPVKAEHWRDGVKIGEYDVFNDITNVGKNYILDTMFHDGSQIASSAWCIGLISSSGYTALAAADTMGSHAGWTEFTGYSQGTRVAWAPGAASGQAIDKRHCCDFRHHWFGHAERCVRHEPEHEGWHDGYAMGDRLVQCRRSGVERRSDQDHLHSELLI